MNISLISLGCAKNQVDSEHLLGRVGPEAVVVDNPGDADVIVINTCSFIESARAESINTIIDAGRLGKRLVVFGCLPGRYREELEKELPEVEAFFGVDEIDRVADHLRGRAGRTGGGRLRLEKTPYTYLKIAEGCNHRCSYCAIPGIRGPYRSVPAEKLVKETEALLEDGVKELILVAQDTTAYGTDRTGDTLPGLLRSLSKTGVPRVRVLYAYPDKVSDELLDTMAELDNVCPYLDIPFQHAARTVLARMNRPGGGLSPRVVTERIRRHIPDITLRTTFLVGFPGETDDEFEELLDFVREMKVDRVGAFTFSPEDGTPAVSLPGRVPRELAEERYERLMELQAEISFEKNKELVGRTLPVLVDETDRTGSIGRLESQAPEVDGAVIMGTSLTPGTIIQARIVQAQNYDLVAEPA